MARYILKKIVESTTSFRCYCKRALPKKMIMKDYIFLGKHCLDLEMQMILHTTTTS